jgi:hypothetical protein
VNWVAIPGRRLFFDGELASGERLTQAHFDATVRRALAAGVFEGVELHDYPTSAKERSLEDFVSHHSIGTDFALRFARSAFCARLPVSGEMLAESVDFLNDLNREYATGAAEYAWSSYHDNCVHTLRNALAAANVWTPKSVNAIKLRQFFHLAVPANEALDLARLGSAGPLLDFAEVNASDPSRHSLLQFGWLPNRHGAVVTVLPVHRDNDLYDTRMRILVLENPFGAGVTRVAEDLLGDPRFVSLRPNLLHYRDVYARLLAEPDLRGTGLGGLRGDRHRFVRRRYDAYLEAQLAEVHALLARLTGAARVPENPRSVATGRDPVDVHP